VAEAVPLDLGKDALELLGFVVTVRFILSHVLFYENRKALLESWSPEALQRRLDALPRAPAAAGVPVSPSSRVSAEEAAATKAAALAAVEARAPERAAAAAAPLRPATPPPPPTTEGGAQAIADANKPRFMKAVSKRIDDGGGGGGKGPGGGGNGGGDGGKGFGAKKGARRSAAAPEAAAPPAVSEASLDAVPGSEPNAGDFEVDSLPHAMAVAAGAEPLTPPPPPSEWVPPEYAGVDLEGAATPGHANDFTRPVGFALDMPQAPGAFRPPSMMPAPPGAPERSMGSAGSVDWL
jgi:hypothetical protein